MGKDAYLLYLRRRISEQVILDSVNIQGNITKSPQDISLAY
jgi:hypothetical protein